MRNTNYKRLITAALVIGWCAVIFSFSSQSASESSETSGGFIETFCNFIIPEFGDFSGSQREAFIESFQFAVRKCAHFTAYGILGFLSWFALFDFKAKLRYAIAVGFSFLYACSDEIHQYFAPGRSNEIRDVLIDTAGAMLGALIAFGITTLFIHYRKQKNTAG
ncbi:MAG: VanZ family protein [Ruminococcus sp.]|nr:VanZ family protein [Ruminococcus sp.]